MSQHARRIEWLVWGGLGLLIATIMFGFLLAKIKLRTLTAKPLPVYGQVADFRLTNQFGQEVTLAQLKGHVWVADVIFTRCPGPCARMTRLMKELVFPAGSQTKLVSVTSDPQFDGPAVLRAYADRAGADTKRWLFLTGSKSEIAKLVIDSLKLTAIEKKPEERESPEDLFIHSTLFVVVDKRGQLRGVYETMGEGIDQQQLKATMLSAVRHLEREE